MDKQLPALYAEYGKYINKFRALPMVLDGLKIVERRLLYSLYEQAREKFTKSAKIVGHCIGNYHPHGDVSTYQSLVSLVHNKLAIGQGNWGTNVGVDDNPPAAQRYTEVKASRHVLDLAFEYIQYIKKEALELDEEPLFLPTKLPICLLGENYCQGIGFGTRCIFPAYEESDLLKRLAWLLGHRKGEPIIKPKSDCKILSDNTILKELLTTGKAKLEYQGIIEQDGSKSVIIKSVPPLRSVLRVLKKFDKEVEIDRAIGITDESTTLTKVRLTILRQRGYQITKLIKKLNKMLLGSVSFDCTMCDEEGSPILVSVDQMLLNVYENYKKVVQNVLNTNISDLQIKIDELELVKKIKPLLPKWLRDHPDEPEAVINGIHTESGIDKEIVHKLFDKYTLSRLLKIKTDTEKLLSDKQSLKEKLQNLENYVWDEKYKS